MGLRFDPVGGGQFKAAVQQMIEAEKQPIRLLEARKAEENARFKLFEQFKSKFTDLDKTLDEMTDFRKFRELKVDLGDAANQVSVTLDKDHAQPGVYQLQLDRLASRTSVITNGFKNPDDPILGTGFITMTLPSGDDAEIYVDEKNSSLRGVANLINQQNDPLIHATVIKDASEPDTPWKLIINGTKEGASNQIAFPEFYFSDAPEDFYVDGNKDAENAQLVFNGFQIESDTNDIGDFLPGVNIRLKEAKPDRPFTLSITQDYKKISAKMKGMVEQINHILGFVQTQNQVDDKTDTRTMLTGDTSLQGIEYRLRNLMHEGFPVTDPNSDKPKMVFLNQLGFEFDKTGQVQFKEDKFAKVLEKDYSKISEAITGPYGFANQLRKVISEYTQFGSGVLALRETGYRDRIKQIDDEIDQKTRQLDRKKQSLTEQFSRLEASLGAMQRQQQYLAANLPGAGGGGSIQQLLGG